MCVWAKGAAGWDSMRGKPRGAVSRVGHPVWCLLWEVTLDAAGWNRPGCEG